MEKHNAYEMFLVLGAVWLIVGLFIFNNLLVWQLGFIFLIIGSMGKRKQHK
jgi:hypothetical protein